jgi:hypothetical protein
MTAGWPASALDALSREAALRGLGNLVLRLAAEFPAFEFGTQRTWNGVSLVAVRRGGADTAQEPMSSSPAIPARCVMCSCSNRAALPLAKHDVT